MNFPLQITPITPKVKNYLQMQNFFTCVGFLAPIAMVVFLMNFSPLPFSWKVIGLLIYSSVFTLPLALILISLFRGEIESGTNIKLLCWTFKIILYLALAFYFFTFIYSIVAEKGLSGYYYTITLPDIVYYGMYLICFFFLVLAIKANGLLINSLRK